jgi:ABC-2 type transport system ATP-binding protein
MDEAERCHRLAFIFRGELLDTGTPSEIVEQRKLRVAELQVEQATAASDLLRASPDVEEVAHYGDVIRLCTRDETDPERLAHELLSSQGISVIASRPARATVEDAFVSMVRDDERRQRQAS